MAKKAKSKQEQKLDQQVVELTAALQRERADAINIRARHQQQMSDLRGVVKIDVIEQLLPVIDNFERSLAHVPKGQEDDNFVKGIKAIVKQFETTLSEIGVVRIKTVGEKFDPNLHEALSGEGDTVVEEVQAGYKLGDQVIRHANVKL